MGFLGLGSSDSAFQASDNLNIAVNYNPQRVTGSAAGNYMANTPATEQTPAIVTRQDKNDSSGLGFDLAASVGLSAGGGYASGGYVDKDTTSTATKAEGTSLPAFVATSGALSQYVPYFAVAAVIISAILIFGGRKK